jgi:hypothetical protein
MYLLRRHDVIEADVLRAIAQKEGVRVGRAERIGLVIGLVAALLVITLFTHGAITGGLRDAPLAKSSSLLLFCFMPWVLWYSARLARLNQVTAAMLEYLRCPHCGYDLRLLPTDPRDGATVCPECGCAWQLEDHSRADDDGDGVSDPPRTGALGTKEGDASD